MQEFFSWIVKSIKIFHHLVVSVYLSVCFKVHVNNISMFSHFLGTCLGSLSENVEKMFISSLVDIIWKKCACILSLFEPVSFYIICKYMKQ